MAFFIRMNNNNLFTLTNENNRQSRNQNLNQSNNLEFNHYIKCLAKGNMHLQILLSALESFVFESNYNFPIMANLNIDSLCQKIGLSSLQEYHFENMMISRDNENNIRNLIENNINNNSNIINNNRNIVNNLQHPNNSIFTQQELIIEQLRILKHSLNELVFETDVITNYFENISLSEFIQKLALNYLNSNCFPSLYLSTINRDTILEFIQCQESRFQLSTAQDNNSNLNGLLDELLNLLVETGLSSRINPNSNYQDSSDDRLIPKCCICLENNCSVIFLPCHHMCCCYQCSRELHSCPICRQNISSCQPVYI